MSAITKTTEPQQVFELAHYWQPKDVEWLIEKLQSLVKEPSLPESATIDEAVELYVDDRCTLARAAELAGIDRWTFQDILRERDIPIGINDDFSFEEIDAMSQIVTADNPDFEQAAQYVLQKNQELYERLS